MLDRETHLELLEGRHKCRARSDSRYLLPSGCTHSPGGQAQGLPRQFHTRIQQCQNRSYRLEPRFLAIIRAADCLHQFKSIAPIQPKYHKSSVRERILLTPTCQPQSDPQLRTQLLSPQSDRLINFSHLGQQDII
jgi:hypothetical protein